MSVVVIKIKYEELIWLIIKLSNFASVNSICRLIFNLCNGLPCAFSDWKVMLGFLHDMRIAAVDVIYMNISFIFLPICDSMR